MRWINESTTIQHESIVEPTSNGVQVICNYLKCSYVENFATVDDAEAAASIHEEVWDVR